MNRLFTSTLCAGMLLMGGAALSFAAPAEIDAQDLTMPDGVKNEHRNMQADRDNNGLADGLQKRMAAMAASDFIDVIVTFDGLAKGQSSSLEARQIVGDFTVEREFSLIHGFKASMTVQQAQALARAPGVFRVQEEAIVTTQLTGATDDFGVIAARNEFTAEGSGIGICILDTGIDISHEQFTSRAISFYDAINGLAESYDDHGHGTHVAAIAMGGGGTGTNANIKGVAPSASIFSAKVLDAQGSGSESQVIDGIQYCANQADVHIISMSLGTAQPSDGLDPMSLAVNCASDPNYSSTCNITPSSPKIAVVAAGNSGPAPETVGSPGAAEKAITIGAVSNWSEDGKGVYLAAFSSRGPNLAGLIKPDISAPGLRILSAKAGSSNEYISYSGTSMATPFASGVIALMLQKFSINWRYRFSTHFVG